MSGPNPWGEVALESQALRSYSIGTLRLTLKRTQGEVWIQASRDDEPPDPDAEWKRWATSSESRIELRPAVLDRLVVVSHELPYHLPPLGESQIYVRIPLFVQVVTVDGSQEVVIAEHPSMVLSDTWWGEFTDGELAYWLTTKARVQVADDLFLPHVGMCPFRLVNRSAEALPVERFAVQVPHLSLFGDGEKIWTDEVYVRYEDSPDGSEIRFGSEPPDEARRARLLAAPRVDPQRGFHARTFDRLRSLSNLGL